MVKLFEMLQKDHREVEDLFEQCEQTEDQQEQARLIKQVLEKLAVHAELEENYFYPVAQRNPNLEEQILESFEEHHAAELIMSEIAEMQPGEECLAKVKVLQEMIEHHINEEETNIFPKCEKVMDRQELDRIGTEVESNKPEFMRKGLNVLITMIREKLEVEAGGGRA